MIVVDTNILAYRFIESAKTSAVERLIQLEARWAAPLLWRSELRNVLSGYLRRGQMSRPWAERILQEAHIGLTAGEHAVEDPIILGLVQNSRCTSYDCEFVALAMMLDVTLVTEDAALLSAFPERCLSLAQALAS